MAVMDHVRTAYSCDCGGSMVFKKGTITSTVRGKQIRVHNAPHYVCKDCKEIVFDSSAKISTLLATAFRNGYSEVDYNEFHG